MKSISRQKNNIGGIAQLYAIPISVLTAITASATPGVFIITLSSTDEVYDISAIAETIRESEDSQQAGAGNYYAQQITATLGKDTPELQLAFEDLINRRLVVVYRDQNDRFKLVGNMTEAMRASYKTDSGAKVADLQKADLVFSGKTTTKSRFIENPFL